MTALPLLALTAGDDSSRRLDLEGANRALLSRKPIDGGRISHLSILGYLVSKYSTGVLLEMELIPLLPPLQAILNSLALGLLILAYYAIRKKNRQAHRLFISGALLVSALFLGSYLTYHQSAGYVPFAGQGAVRPLFFGILISHIICAAAIVPLLIATVFYALQGAYARHRRIAHWTLPLWMYTSVTGMLVYLFVFQLYPPG